MHVRVRVCVRVCVCLRKTINFKEWKMITHNYCLLLSIIYIFRHLQEFRRSKDV